MVSPTSSTFPDLHLYHATGTRSDRVKLVLDRLDLPYSITRIDTARDEQKGGKYLKVNPFGTLPGLTVDDVPIVESAAQTILIADLDDEHRLAPPVNHPSRKRYLHWIIATAATLEPMVTPIFAPNASKGADEGVRRAITIQTQMFVGPYCAGSELSAADIFVHWGMRMVARLGLLDDAPLWKEYVERLEDELRWNEVG